MTVAGSRCLRHKICVHPGHISMPLPPPPLPLPLLLPLLPLPMLMLMLPLLPFPSSSSSVDALGKACHKPGTGLPQTLPPKCSLAYCSQAW